MKTLTIHWQRLVNDSGQTCDRCSDTENAIEKAFDKLKRTFVEFDIEVTLEKKSLDLSIFTKDPPSIKSHLDWSQTTRRMDRGYSW